MKGKITKTSVDGLAAGAVLADTEVKGFLARRLPSGVVSYGYRYSDRSTGKRRWAALGLHGSITPDQARNLAKKRAGEVADHRDPVGEQKAARAAAEKAGAVDAMTVNVILDDFVKRHVRKNALRGGDEVERIFNRYVRPAIGSQPIHALRRGEIVKMLDAIEDGGAPVMADRTLAHLRKAFNWYAARDESFNSPIVRGMARTKPTERARSRILADDEICDVWQALDGMPAPFPGLVRTLLLTAQRRNEVGNMRWREISGTSWTIPAERYKTGAATVVPLTAGARAACGERRAGGPVDDDFVFTATAGKKPFNGYSKAKAALDERISTLRTAEERPPMPPWVLHDLRRTARSLMSRTGVSSDIAERVLGHVISGVRGVYDRYAYVDEKRDALERLAGVVERILNPTEGNVVELRHLHASA